MAIYNYPPLSLAVPPDVRISDTNGDPIVIGQQTMANSLAVVIASNQTAIPVTTTSATLDFGASAQADRVAALLGNSTGAAAFGTGAVSAQTLRVSLATEANAAATPLSARLSDGTSFYNAPTTSQLPSALGQAAMAASLSVAIASNQSSIPVTTTPATLDFGSTASAARVAALIGVGSTATSVTNPVPVELSNGVGFYTAPSSTQLPAALGQTTMANSLSVTLASNQSALSISQNGLALYGSTAIDTSSTNITSAAWVELIASTTGAATYVNIFNGSGSFLELGVGAAAAEARVLIIPAGGVDSRLTIASGARVSVRRISGVSSDMTSGFFSINVLG